MNIDSSSPPTEYRIVESSGLPLGIGRVLCALSIACWYSISAWGDGRLLWADVEIAENEKSAESLAIGKRVYAARCVLCHGKEGKGDGASAAMLSAKPRNFTLGLFKLRSTADFPTKEDLYRTITVGFPAYGMPSFRYLSSNERWALVEYVRELGRTGAQSAFEERLSRAGKRSADFAGDGTAVNETIRDKASALATALFKPGTVIPLLEKPRNRSISLERGREKYEALACGTCHGSDGRGDGFASDMLADVDGDPVVPLDLTKNRWWYKRGNRSRDIVAILLTGLGGTPMPVFFEKLALHDGLWDLAEFVGSLSATTDRSNLEDSPQ